MFRRSWNRLPYSVRRQFKRTLRAFGTAALTLVGVLWAVYLLDSFDVPIGVATALDRLLGRGTGFANLHRWLHEFMNSWGDLATFLIGFVIGFLIPNRAEKQTEEILEFIRGNLLDFESVFIAVCTLLTELKDDDGSVFVMVAQSPLLGADVYGETENEFWTLLHARSARTNRVVCLSPYDQDTPKLSSPLGRFYHSLEVYNPTKPGAVAKRTRRSESQMFNEALRLVRHLAQQGNTDVVFAEPIPYQVFLGRRSDGHRKCVLLLNGWEAIKRNLPAGGFVSQDPVFLQLIEDSVQILLGGDGSIYESQQAHTKRILKECVTYAADVGSPQVMDLASARLREEDIGGVSLVRFPYVFDPLRSESAEVMARAVTLALSMLRTEHPDRELVDVWDVGCGSGYLSVVAAKAQKVRVKACDISGFAVAATTHNVRKHALEAAVTVLENGSVRPDDVFASFEGSKADVVVADLPFVDCLPDAHDGRELLLQRAYFDAGLALNRAVLGQCAEHLNEGGRLVISFSDLGPVRDFREAIADAGWKIEDGTDRAQEKNGHLWYAFVLHR